MLLALLLAQLAPANPAGPIVTNPATMGRYAFFEAFPANGAGTFGACSTTAPTGVRGEALTFARASTATCTKTATGGLATTGIANGDLVVMASNQPRVEYDSAGKLKLLVEASRTNSLLRSQEFDNAAWSSSTGAGAVTVTADQAIAPDGTLTADRLQVSACPAAGVYSARLQAMALVSTRTWSVYVRGNGTSGNIGMIVGGGAAYSGVVCPYVSTSWTRCSVSANAVAGDAWIGCVNATVASPNPGNTGAADVFVWGGQVEDGPYATSYIPTTSAAVTRSAETPSFNGSSWPTATYSFAATVARMANTNGAVLDGVSSGGVGLIFFAGLRQRHSPGPTDVAGAISFAANTPSRFAASYTGTTGQVFQDGVSVAGPSAQTAPSAWPSSVYLGLWSVAASTADGLYGEICLDPNPSRCR